MPFHKYISRKRGSDGKWQYDYGNLYDKAKSHAGYKIKSAINKGAKNLRNRYDSGIAPKVEGVSYYIKDTSGKAKMGVYNGLNRLGNKAQDKVFGTAWRSYQDPQQYIRKTKRGGMDIYTVPRYGKKFAAPADNPKGLRDTLAVARSVADEEVKKAKKRGFKRNIRRAATKTKYAANRARNKAYLAGEAVGRAAASTSVKARKLAAKGRRLIKLLGNQGG